MTVVRYWGNRNQNDGTQLLQYRDGTAPVRLGGYADLTLAEQIECNNRFSVSSTYGADILALAPALWWRMSESGGTTAADSSGNGRGGTATGNNSQNAASLLPSGDVASGAFFQLGNAAATVSGITADAYSPYTVGSSLTLAAWIGLFAATPAWTIFAANGVSGGQPHPTLEYFPPQGGQSSGTMRFYGTVNTFPYGFVDWTVNLPISAVAVPVHVAFTFNDTTGISELYINGVSQGRRGPLGFNGVASHWDAGTPGRFQIGFRGAGQSFESADGWFDEVCVFTRILLPGEIKMLMTPTAP